MHTQPINVACVGAGYFAQFHLEAWKRIAEVRLVAVCDRDQEKADRLAKKFHVPGVYGSIDELLENESITVLDIITPPETHFSICQKAAQNGIHLICQKPLAPSLPQATEMVAVAHTHGVRFMVHENWRFQPWYRKIKQLLDEGSLGKQLHSINFRMRMGDGWSPDAYLDRQPYFRTMPRLLVYETGIHFIDTFRYLMGEPESVYADLTKLNPRIAGEDSGIILFQFANGAKGIWDANRYNESNHPNPRYTFGEMLLEGNSGSIRLYSDGQITLQPLGKTERSISYYHEDKNFAGDCVYYLQKHFVECFLLDQPFENSALDYLRNLEIQEAVYQSARTGRPVSIGPANDYALR